MIGVKACRIPRVNAVTPRPTPNTCVPSIRRWGATPVTRAVQATTFITRMTARIVAILRHSARTRRAEDTAGRDTGTRAAQRLRSALVEYFPAALVAFDDLTAADTLELLGRTPVPAQARRLTVATIAAALKRARRRDITEKARKIRAAFGTDQLPVPAVVSAAYAATVRTQVAILTTLNAEIAQLEEAVADQFGRHPDAEILLSQPGLGPVLAARVLAEFGDDAGRYTDAKARKNYAGTSPITRASRKKKIALARYVRNNRLADALHQQAFCALNASPGVRAYYDTIRARGTGHHAALRQLANRLVGILHGCLKTHTRYNGATAWPQAVTIDVAA